MPKVTDLFCYPVKGCRGIRLERLEIGPYGPHWDREWMIVEADEPHEFVTQRKDPRLATITVSIVPQGRGEALYLSIDSVGSTVVPDYPSGWNRRRTPTAVHNNPSTGFDEGDDVADLLSTFFQRRVRLLRRCHDEPRLPSRVPEGKKVPPFAFADSYPLLLASRGSLDALNAARPEGKPEILMDRFRPNIVVDAVTPWVEETWRELRINGIPMHGVKPSRRCPVITTDQQTGERAPWIQAHLLAVHSADRKGKQVPIFGMNLVPERVPGDHALLTTGAYVDDIVVGPRPEL